MPTEATVYRVLLVMGDDIDQERSVARDVVIDWNSTTGRSQDIYLEPVSAVHLNLDTTDLAEEIDAVLGTFWTTVENARTTSDCLTDTVRQLAFDGHTPSIIGFSEQNVPTSKLDPDKYAAVQDFREECRKTGYFTYATLEEYESRLQQSLSRMMDEILSDPRRQFVVESEHEGPSEYDVEVDYDRLELSADVHREQDERNLDRVVERFEE
ncbi:hypothetical protein Halru_2830 [Halovivax ruber XH-70]|uniref:Uncharacterized protein n=1 Tax=Halovivax ruber (strain DSM 18193 / JCM 13892 / XH-70) TaxID=797302 RepID=L0IGR1_HALRX|nr:hypothetical protein [Halovivax ruber]AGB17401.1 hypothetical protein Halru_2830 [Halovivax ruber XH-70]